MYRDMGLAAAQSSNCADRGSNFIAEESTDKSVRSAG